MGTENKDNSITYNSKPVKLPIRIPELDKLKGVVEDDEKVLSSLQSTTTEQLKMIIDIRKDIKYLEKETCRNGGNIAFYSKKIEKLSETVESLKYGLITLSAITIGLVVTIISGL